MTKIATMVNTLAINDYLTKESSDSVLLIFKKGKISLFIRETGISWDHVLRERGLLLDHG